MKNIIENWKGNPDKANKLRAIFMNLYQASNTLDHSLLIAKLEGYGFDSLSFQIMKNCLTNRKQRFKVGSYSSVLRKITSGIPQGSILSNIFINDIFLFAKNSTLCNYGEGNTQFFL